MNYQTELTCPKCNQRTPYLYPLPNGGYLCSICKPESELVDDLAAIDTDCPCCGSQDARYRETLGKRAYVCCRDCGWIYALEVK